MQSLLPYPRDGGTRACSVFFFSYDRSCGLSFCLVWKPRVVVMTLRLTFILFYSFCLFYLNTLGSLAIMFRAVEPNSEHGILNSIFSHSPLMRLTTDNSRHADQKCLFFPAPACLKSDRFRRVLRCIAVRRTTSRSTRVC